MADNIRLTELIAKIRKAEQLNAIDVIEYIDKVETNNLSKNKDSAKYTDLLNQKDIKDIVQGYKSYPLYLIKYIFTVYPKTSSSEALDHIVKSRERRSDLMECILTSFSVKLCEIPDISFDCRLVLAHQTVTETKTDLNLSDSDNSIDELFRQKSSENKSNLQDLMEVLEEIDSRVKSPNTCNCMDRRHWSYLYDFFLDLIAGDERFMFESYNVNYSITNLVAHTDVADSQLGDTLLKSIDNPERWRSLLIFIKKTGLISSVYGDIIFSIRDAVILNGRAEEKDKNQHISRFKENVLLSKLIIRYNQYHRNMSQITENMYITDINGARNTDLVRDKKIDCVVSLTKRSIFKASNVRYFHIKIDDMESVDFLSMTLDYADKVIELIKQDQIILVHCYKGVSRSVSFVILVLVKQGMGYEEALDFVKKRRPAANPNPAFKRQLKEYSRKINRI
jgi:protein-tyrosine phosphatase